MWCKKPHFGFLNLDVKMAVDYSVESLVPGSNSNFNLSPDWKPENSL